jgi:ABC-type transport system involved in multi-copper enzyme maturation permease subunit
VKPVVAIARNTIREALRERIALAAVVFGAAMVLAAQVLSPLALGEGRKIVTDFGLAGSSLLATLLAITLGTSLLHKELERRTIYSVMAKPVRRTEFLLGKFLGLWSTGAMLLATTTLLTLAVLTVAYRETPWLLTGSLALTMVEIGIVTAFVVFYSSFTTPGLAAFFTVTSLVAGHFAEDLLYFGTHGAAPAVEIATTAAYWVLPHLSVFNARGLVVHGTAVPPERLLFAVSYGLLYVGALLTAAAAIFERREFR